MAVSAESFKAWVDSKSGDQALTLSSLYLGEELSMFNADQVVAVVNGLWHDFCQDQSASADGLSKAELGERFGEWTFVRGGMADAAIALDDASLRVDRFCGGWPLRSEKTVALLEAIYAAAPDGRRP